MKKKAFAVVAVMLACCLGAFGLAGCGASSSSSAESDTSTTHLAPTVSEAHAVRMSNLNKLGPSTCYGCHGSNDTANPMLTGIKAMPDNHYLNEDPSTHTLDPSRNLCNTCHVQG